MCRIFRYVIFACLLFGCLMFWCPLPGLEFLPGSVALPIHLKSALAAAVPSDSATNRAEMPVRMVVLFSSGVGYFEHGGTVEGDGSTELHFKSNQINDILKSLVLEDLDGGKVSTIAYPSQEPVERTLKNFQVNITSNPCLGDLLNQLRGASVRVTVHAEQIDGTILGLEKRRKTLLGHENQILDEWMLNIVSGGAIRSIWLDEVQKVELRDTDLERELNHALSALAESRNQDKKPVIINCQGDGNRRVRLRYVIESPIWKTSYRLILPQQAGAKCKLQGWAIVENQTDSDWNNVQLSLVSGRPVSFIEDLYKPLYVTRPIVTPELYASLRPQNYESTAAASAPYTVGRELVDKIESIARRAEAAADKSESVFMKHMKAGSDDESEEEARWRELGVQSEQFDPTSSIASAASTEKVGELFQYTVGNVSLPRNRSAMIPILTDDVTVERVSIFNAEVMPGNPLRGVILHNSTDKHVMRGPMSVFECNACAGDAQVGHLPPGQDRLLSYALDLEMLVNAPKTQENSGIQTATIRTGYLNVSRKDVISQEYAVQNKSDGERTLIIEHRFRPGWKLANPQPTETTATHHRLKLIVPKGKTENLTVVEERVRDKRIAILPAEIDSLEFYCGSGQIPKDIRETLTKAIELKRSKADTERRLKEKRDAVEEIVKEQNRIRSNMTTVNPTSQYYSRLLEKLNSQETTIETIQAELPELEKKLEDQSKELERYPANLSVG